MRTQPANQTKMQNQFTKFISIIFLLDLHFHGLYCSPFSLNFLNKASNSKEVNNALDGHSINNVHGSERETTEHLHAQKISEGTHHTAKGSRYYVEGNQFCHGKSESQINTPNSSRDKHLQPYEIALKQSKDKENFKRAVSKKDKLKLGGHSIMEPLKHFDSDSEDKAPNESLTSQQHMSQINKNNPKSPNRTNIRNLPQENMNGLCIQFAKHLSKEFCTEVRQLLNSFTRKIYPSEVSTIWNQDILSPMVYFLLMRNPTKRQWNRIQTLSAFALVAFYEIDPEAAKDFNSERKFQFLLWHTEMIYHLTNPHLLHYVNEPEDQYINNGAPISRFRSTSKISKILLILANQAFFDTRQKHRLPLLELIQGFLRCTWKEDYKNNYPFSVNPSGPKRVIKDEWLAISQKISEYSSVGNMDKYSLSWKKNEPMISKEYMIAIFGAKTFNGYFIHDLKEIDLKREDIREHLKNKHKFDILVILGYWMKSHHEGHLKFTDPFSGTALLSYIDPTQSDTSFESNLSKLDKVDKRRATIKKSSRNSYWKNSITCLGETYSGNEE